jgi:type IV pilus assembly protein PilA
MFQATLRRLREERAAEMGEAEAAEGGFTLIELMVVLLIIAILLAIAIPTFLGVTNTAGDRAAQSNLTNALTESKALYQVNQSYSGYTAGSFAAQAPEFTWTTSPCLSAQTNCVSATPFNVASAGDGQGVALAVASSKTNTCWYAFDLESSPGSPITGTIPTAGVFYAKQTPIPGTGCSSSAVNPDSDTHVVFGASGTATSGQSYSSAPGIT